MGYYTNLKGLKKVNVEHSLLMFAYNIKRCFILVPMLIEKFAKLGFLQERPQFFSKLVCFKPVGELPIFCKHLAVYENSACIMSKLGYRNFTGCLMYLKQKYGIFTV